MIIILSSRYQIRTIIKHEIFREAKPAVMKLLKMGCYSVILTLGAKGALYTSQDDQIPIHIKTPQVHAIDTTVF